MRGSTGVRELALLELAAQLQEASTLDGFADTLLAGLLELVPGEVAGWNEIDLTSGRVSGRGVPADASEGMFPLVSRYMAHHPLIAHYERTASREAARISDVCDAREWRKNPLYVDVFGPLGLPYQIGVPLLSTPQTLSAAAISRGGRDFTTRDVRTLNALAPLATNAERSLRWRLSLESALAALAPHEAHALVAKDGTVVAAGSPATPHLSDRFAMVRLPRADKGDPPPLTRRQFDVIRAVADGSTVSAAARRLGLSPRTVDKHLERAYAKLGVSGRVAAITKLRDIGWLGTVPSSQR
jgi:DNA-binding CsgD family transcriptional regulator